MFDFRLFLPDGPGGFGGPGGGPGGPGDPGGFVPPKANYEEKRPETDWILSESAEYPGGIVLYEGHLPVAPEGKALLMTVDGVPTTIAAGTYAGKVVFTVYTLSNIPETEADMTVGDFRTALYMVSGKPVPTGLEAVAGDYRVNGTMLENVNMETNINDFNGVIFAGDGTKTGIRNSTFRFHGGGTSEGKGGCIMTVGNADVLIDNVEFWNKGTLTAIAGSGHSHIEVKNSVLYGARDFTVSKLCPWVLGINGNNRLTNAIESAQAYYHDSIVVAQSWAALSTDAGRGVHLHGENMFAGIGRLEPYNEAHAADYTAAPELNGKKYGFYLGNSAIGESG